MSNLRDVECYVKQNQNKIISELIFSNFLRLQQQKYRKNAFGHNLHMSNRIPATLCVDEHTFWQTMSSVRNDEYKLLCQAKSK